MRKLESLKIVHKETTLKNSSHSLYKTMTHKVYTSLMSKYVIVVDDNPSDLILASALVEALGVPVLKAEGGFEALEHVDENDVCLIIVDLQMPKMSGIELLKRLQRIEKVKNQIREKKE